MSKMKELKARMEESHKASECTDDWDLLETSIRDYLGRTKVALDKVEWLQGKNSDKGVNISILDLKSHLELTEDLITQDLKHIFGYTCAPKENPSGNPSCNPTAGSETL